MKKNHIDELASLATGLDTIFRTTCIDERAEINGRWCDVAMSVAMSEHKGHKGIGDMFTHCLPIGLLVTHWFPIGCHRGHWTQPWVLSTRAGRTSQAAAISGPYWAESDREIW